MNTQVSEERRESDALSQLWNSARSYLLARCLRVRALGQYAYFEVVYVKRRSIVRGVESYPAPFASDY